MCVRVPAISIFFSILAVAACLAQNPSQVGNESYRDQPFDASPTGNEQDDFALAEDYYNGGAGNQALVAYRRFVKLYPSSPKAAQAQYKIAESPGPTQQSLRCLPNIGDPIP
jgi:TolA-binding protein